ncbi:MAG TPA: FAD-binding protein [Vicinamibacterales bacterium]|nr:FAD-binding protein [Vicinamibacterales bacterium]
MYTLTAAPADERRPIDDPADADLRLGAPARYQSDFGRSTIATPRLAILARSEHEVVTALAAARARGLRYRVRGAGHSCDGQSLAADGMVIANENADASPVVALGDGLFDLAARAHWRGVERALNRAGWTVPVLPDYLDLSIGGTLSVGGFGFDSASQSTQLDHVERIRLIAAHGHAVWCSATERPDLFSRALAGLGQAGVIERVVVRARPFRPASTLLVTRHPSLEGLIDSIGWMPEHPERVPPLFKGVTARGATSACYGFASTTLREARRLDWRPPGDLAIARRYDLVRHRQLRALSVKLWVAAFGRAHRLWSDYVLDYEGLVAFERFLQTLLARDAFGGCLKSIYVLAIRKRPRAVALPFDAATAIAGSIGFGIGLYSMVPAGRHDLVRRVRVAAAACLERCLELNGRPYRYGCHDIDERMARSIYGDAAVPEMTR